MSKIQNSSWQGKWYAFGFIGKFVFEIIKVVKALIYSYRKLSSESFNTILHNSFEFARIAILLPGARVTKL